MKENAVCAYDVKLEEDYTVHVGEPGEQPFGPLAIPADSVFVMGENRRNSYDSRFWGPVPIADIKGKATRVYQSIDKDTGASRSDRFWMKVE